MVIKINMVIFKSAVAWWIWIIWICLFLETEEQNQCKLVTLKIAYNIFTLNHEIETYQNEIPSLQASLYFLASWNEERPDLASGGHGVGPSAASNVTLSYSFSLILGESNEPGAFFQDIGKGKSAKWWCSAVQKMPLFFKPSKVVKIDLEKRFSFF